MTIYIPHRTRPVKQKTTFLFIYWHLWPGPIGTITHYMGLLSTLHGITFYPPVDSSITRKDHSPRLAYIHIYEPFKRFIDNDQFPVVVEWKSPAFQNLYTVAAA